jgi:hypothetical protein
MLAGAESVLASSLRGIRERGGEALPSDGDTSHAAFSAIAAMGTLNPRCQPRPQALSLPPAPKSSTLPHRARLPFPEASHRVPHTLVNCHGSVDSSMESRTADAEERRGEPATARRSGWKETLVCFPPSLLPTSIALLVWVLTCSRRNDMARKIQSLVLTACHLQDLVVQV